jgi:chromosome segregation ATPase
MINFFSNLTNGWDGAFSNNPDGCCSVRRTSRRGKLVRQANNSNTCNLESSLNLNQFEERNLEHIILMVGNLNQAALRHMDSSKENMDDLTAESFSDDNSTELQELVDNLRKERDNLKDRCKELEDTIFDTRQENDLYKVKMTMAMGNLRSQVESLCEDKSCLEEKCSRLGQQLHSLRENFNTKLEVITSLENDLKEQASNGPLEV